MLASFMLNQEKALLIVNEIGNHKLIGYNELMKELDKSQSKDISRYFRRFGKSEFD